MTVTEVQATLKALFHKLEVMRPKLRKDGLWACRVRDPEFGWVGSVCYDPWAPVAPSVIFRQG